MNVALYLNIARLSNKYDSENEDTLSLGIDLPVHVPTSFGTQHGESNLRKRFNPLVIECQN